MSVPTKQQVQTAIESGFSNFAKVVQSGGCGRAYVTIHEHGDWKASGEEQALNKKLTRQIRNLVKSVAKSMGKIYQSKGYGVSHALYVGYDNADGGAWSKATQIAANLQEIGISAYVDGVGD